MALVGSELQRFHPATKEHYQFQHYIVTSSTVASSIYQQFKLAQKIS